MTSNTLRVNRTTLARRYLPLAAVIAVQLLIIAVAPSKVGTNGQQVAAGGFGGEGEFGTGAGDEVVGGEAGAAGLEAAGGGAGAGGAAGGPGRAGAARTGGVPTGGVSGTITDDTTHCVGDRQFDPGIWPWVPACIGKFKGDNGGATAIGVTKDTVKIVVMRGNYGTTVDAILTASGANPSAPDFDAALRTAEKFINERFELYGRKIQFKQRKFRNGTGGEGPPNWANLRNEVREIVQEEKPFGVIFSNPQAGPIFNEFTKLGVVNLGGYGNTDAFFKANAPYHWDVNMSGSELAIHSANWWCTRMHGQKAAFAGERNPANDMRNTTRVLGIVGTDEEENQKAVGEFEALIARQCGAKVAHKYFYSPNVQTAPAQRRAAIEKMREAPQSTTIMCWCDQVAPAFLYDEEELNNYYPENVMIAMPYMDDDDPAQEYDHFFDPQRPANEYPTYENGFGFAQYPEDEALDKDRAARVWKAGGGAGPKPNWDAAGDYDYFMMIATLIQYAGPKLTAENIAAGAFRSQPIAPGGGADPRLPPRAFSPGDYTWNDAVREVYWSPKKKSPGSGADGAYTSMNGGRWFTGAFPAGPLALPPKPR